MELTFDSYSFIKLIRYLLSTNYVPYIVWEEPNRPIPCILVVREMQEVKCVYDRCYKKAG